MINIQNVDDSECYKWCLVRYLHPADHHPSTNLTKIFQLKLQTFTKLKKGILLPLVFLIMKRR